MRTTIVQPVPDRVAMMMQRKSHVLAAAIAAVVALTVTAVAQRTSSNPPVPRSGSIVNSPGVYALSVGPSAGDAAVFVVGRTVRPGWRQIAPAENHPAGPIDPHVGCYAVERSAWNDSAGAITLSSAVTPDHIQLHWQHSWYWGREYDLVATDARGAVPGQGTVRHLWNARGADSVQVVFGTGFSNAIYRLARNGADLVGTVTKYGDEIPGPEPAARVHLRRIQCPARPGRPAPGG